MAFEELRQKVNDLGQRLDKMLGDFEAHGVLDAEQLLQAEQLRVQHAKTSAMLEELERGSEQASGHETVAAEIEELNSTITRWMAYTDRDFKAS